MSTKEQLESFQQFATRKLGDDGTEPSLDELYSLWRAQNPTANELAESVEILKQAHADLEAGNTGTPARQSLRNTCEALGLSIDE